MVTRHPKKLPRGCDQQGRYPQAAEASTELGVEEPPEPSIWAVVIKDTIVPAAAVGALAVVVLIWLGKNSQ